MLDVRRRRAVPAARFRWSGDTDRVDAGTDPTTSALATALDSTLASSATGAEGSETHSLRPAVSLSGLARHARPTDSGITLPRTLDVFGSDGRRYPQLLKGNEDLRQDAIVQQAFEVINDLFCADEGERGTMRVEASWSSTAASSTSSSSFSTSFPSTPDFAVPLASTATVPESHSPTASDQDLRLRTYRVLPLCGDAGLMEWVSGTIVLGEYLTKKPAPGAHGRYRPMDWQVDVCRAMMDLATANKRALVLAEKNRPSTVQDAAKPTVATSGKPTESLSPRDRELLRWMEDEGINPGEVVQSPRRAYDLVTSHFRPVFRYFFRERFPRADVWSARVRAYRASVAAASGAGYALGIGDRHQNNILLDVRTGEVVHIDFGHVFDSGTFIATPERVPFRLTRDTVDGMGSEGVRGAFSASLRTTLRVLRERQDVLAGVLRVVLDTPLKRWTGSAGELLAQVAAKLREDEARDDGAEQQAREDGWRDGREEAERVVAVVREKVDGRRANGGRTMSVDALAQRLIEEATDPENLCRLFSGWHPFL